MIRNYCKVLISMLLLVAAIPTSARSFTLQGEASEPSLCESAVSTLDNKNIQENKVGQKTEAYIEQRGMIRRGATKALFIPKGQWMVGGQIGWNQWNSENLNLFMLTDLNLQGHTFSAGPCLGYFFSKNMAAGLRFSYKRNYINVGSLGLSLGDALNFGLSDIGYLQHNYKSTAFMRSYIPIGESKIFGLFGELQLNYTFSEGKSGVGVGESRTEVYECAHSLGIGLGGGLVVFLTDFAAAEVMLNVGGYDFKWGEQNINNVEQGSHNSSGANYRLDLFSLKFGVTFYL